MQLTDKLMQWWGVITYILLTLLAGYGSTTINPEATTALNSIIPDKIPKFIIGTTPSWMLYFYYYYDKVKESKKIYYFGTISSIVIFSFFLHQATISICLNITNASNPQDIYILIIFVFITLLFLLMSSIFYTLRLIENSSLNKEISSLRKHREL